MDSFTYALVAAFDDNGTQIINITNPAIPSPVANITDGDDYPILNGSRAITTVTLDSFTYAIVTAFNDNGIQIINITNPALSPAANITYDAADYAKLRGPYGISSHNHQLVHNYALMAIFIMHVLQKCPISPMYCFHL